MQVSVASATPIKRDWHSGFLDLCAEPGGGLLCYVCFCPTCAAGDIAEAAGRSYCMSCFVCPAFCSMCYPGHLAGDREALAKKYGVDDLGCVCNTILFMAGCFPCLIFQALNHVRAADKGLLAGYVAVPQGSAVVVQQQAMYQAPMVIAVQPSPADYGYAQQGGYAQPGYAPPGYATGYPQQSV